MISDKKFLVAYVAVDCLIRMENYDKSFNTDSDELLTNFETAIVYLTDSEYLKEE